VKIGFKIFDEAGDKNDEGEKYFGWSSQYDEWLDNYTIRIQRYFK
jgi:hypothetical protein